MVWLAWAIAVLATVAASTGLFTGGGPGHRPFIAVHGTAVDVYGTGLYRNDSFLIGVGLRGTDAATLLVAIPLLVGAVTLYRRGSARAAMLMPGALAYFAYYYASQSLGTAYNPLFIVYVAIASAAAWAVVLAIGSIDLHAITESVARAAPMRGTAVFLSLIGVVLIAVWLPPIVSALVRDETPRPVEHYTTVVTWALDLGAIAPFAFVGGALLRRRRPAGYMIAASLLTMCLTIGVALLAQGTAQILADVPLTTREIVMFVVPFALLTLGAIWPMVALIRRIPA